MASDMPLDYAVFQLSPRRSRCELFVSYDGTMEKLASGLVKPFVTSLKVAEEQVASAVKSIKLEVESYDNADTWFTKGTLERFVRFVSKPEVLEAVNTCDAEMSQLESARRIYSQGADDQSTATGGDRMGATPASDATKKELLRAIDVRLEAVKQDLTTACSHAFAAGFNPETIPELQRFADHFGAHRLSEACNKVRSLSQRRPDLFLTTSATTATAAATATANSARNSSDKGNPLRSSAGSDMSLDDLSDNQSQPSTCEKPQSTTTTAAASTTTAAKNDLDDNKSTQSSSGTPQLTRRLSVQERISLFESKQKESSSSSPSLSSNTPSSTGARPEHRRLPSDVNSSTDKAVLRRWSGASDMSIDVSGERKESDSNANTPTPTSSTFPAIFHLKSKDQGTLNPEDGDKDKAKFGVQSGLEEPPLSDSGSKIPSFPRKLSEQPSGGVVRSRAASFGRADDFGLENQLSFLQVQLKSPLIASEEKGKSPWNGGSKAQEDSGQNIQSMASGVDSRLDGQSIEAESEGLRSKFSSSQRTMPEVSSESKTAESNPQPLILKKLGEADLMHPQPKWRASGVEEGGKSARKDFSESIEKQSEKISNQVEDSGQFGLKFQGRGPVSEQAKKSAFQPIFSEKSVHEDQEAVSSTSLGTVDQAQRVRQPKGNHGLNDDLKMKANELEKLFAEHKLRVPGDQSNSARKIRPAETPKEQEGSSVIWKPAVQSSPTQLGALKMESEPVASPSNVENFNSTPLMKNIDIRNYDVTPTHNAFSLVFSEDSRGKLYQKYMQKRDAKLKEDWSSRRAEKEAKLKALQDTLEKSRAEMKVKLAGSADKRSSARDASRRAEKLRSFNVRSAMKREQPVDSFMSDKDEDQAEFLGKKLSETFLGDSSSRTSQNKRSLPNKNTASTTPRNSSIPNPWSSGKTSNSAAGRRRLNSDNSLAQSVPNFSDLRKENTKPSSAASKPACPQGRNHARKKSTSEDLPIPIEEKPRRTKSLKKSTVGPMGLNDSRNTDDLDYTGFLPSKYDIEEENDRCDKFSNDISNGAGHFNGLGIGRPKASVMVEAMRNGQDFDDLNFEAEEMMDVAKEEEEDFGLQSADMDNSKGRLSQESEKSGNSGYENNDAFRFSHAGLPSVNELPTSIPSIFGTQSKEDSLGEIPNSWNSGIQNAFSFSHEISDIDASDSPIGSPASWNFHTLGPTDTEASRMRKKWGTAQKPVVASDSSHSLSRKDVTKGIKRFLKFGRKNRASEGLPDWISATTSEGDDDTEDGRELPYRSSDDLRKSRMGFSHSHHSDEGFNEIEMLNEQAPKSFFSLSNFRSKGSDSKPR